MAELSAETKRLLENVSTATLTTQLFKHGLSNQYIQGVFRLTKHGRSMVGQAFTLRYIPAREDIDDLSVFDDYDHPQRKAVETIPPGKVLVMDCRGDATAASAGGILVTRMQVRGVAGVVTDGGLRDSPEMAEFDIPCYTAKGTAPTNLIRHHADKELNVPIGCGGVAVYPDDVIVGDREGVVVIPAHLADEIAVAAAAQEEMEAFILEKVQGGAPLRGTYPPNEEVLKEFEDRKKS